MKRVEVILPVHATYVYVCRTITGRINRDYDLSLSTNIRDKYCTYYGM